MDRTIARINTEEIINEVNNVIKTGLEKLLGDHLYRYELLEKTHEAIMNLPNVRHHLNLAPLPQCEFKRETKDVTTDFETKYGHMIEKLLNRIDELTLEVNQLKHSYKPEHFEVVKLEQKENIKLEIQEDEEAASEADEEASEADEEASEAEDEVASEAEDEVASEADEVATVADLEDEVADLEAEEEEAEEEASEVDEEAIEVDEEASEATVASLEVETEASSEAEEEKAEPEEEEYIEIDIDDVTYCTNNEDNGFIYQLTEDGDVGDKVGYLKDGEPFFYADEK
jgi:hypothetical protein